LSEYFEAESEHGEKCETCDNCRKPLTERLEIETPETPEKLAEAEILQKIKQSAMPKIAIGEIVGLPQELDGEVKSIEDDKVTVALPNGEIKMFKREFVTAQNEAD
jgi:hypothetical protein